MVLSIHLRKSGKQQSEEKGSTLLRHNTGNEDIYPISQETDASLVNRLRWWFRVEGQRGSFS
jgi:hypothetical protein